MRNLKKGMIGDDVKVLQQFLGVSVDGAFGNQTEIAVKKWQQVNGLVVDGIVGPKTWNKMFKDKKVLEEIIYNPLLVHITKSLNRSIKYLAIHFTAGTTSKEGSAQKVKNVFEVRKASADFCIDDKEIVQFNPDLKNYYCWAVGDAKNWTTNGGKLYGIATNKNTISIEICSNIRFGALSTVPNHSGWYFTEDSLNNAIKLTKALMQKYNIPIENVVRHYDISGKLCPGLIGWNNGQCYTTMGKQIKEYNNSDEKWKAFKEALK